MTTLSPDTDRRFVDTVIARRLVDPETVARLAGEHERELAGGKAAGSLAEFLCARGVLARRAAAEILRAVRERAAQADAIGGYVLERELGRGGMGAVWLARHRTTGAMRAIKVLDGPPDPELLARFRREAEALARVGGDFVVPVHEIGVAKGRLFFAMSVMPGGSLRARLAHRGASPWREAVALAGRLARALERCHAVGLIHRDLKPDNVLFDAEGRACLADFGVARDLTGSSLTETGTILGTPVYMPPEQLAGRPVDVRADVYALGAVLHELLSGARAFDGASAYEVFEAKQRGAFAPLPGSVPPAVAALVARALAPDPSARPGSARELAEELDRLLVDPKAGTPRIAAIAASLVGVALAVAVGQAVALRSRESPRGDVPPPPPPAISSEHVEVVPDDLDGSEAALLRAAAVIVAQGGSVSEARTFIDRARSLAPSGTIPPAGLACVAMALAERIERIAADPHMAPGPSVVGPYRDLRSLLELGSRLRIAMPIGPNVAELAASYATFKGKVDRPRDWPGCFEAALLALESRKEFAADAARLAVDCAGEKAIVPDAERVIEKTALVAGPNSIARCLALRVEFYALKGETDRAIELAIALVERGPLAHTTAVILADGIRICHAKARIPARTLDQICRPGSGDDLAKLRLELEGAPR